MRAFISARANRKPMQARGPDRKVAWWDQKGASSSVVEGRGESHRSGLEKTDDASAKERLGS